MNGREDTRDPIPAPLAPLFSAAWQEVALVHAKWRVTQQLFGKSEARVALLNRTAADFFALCQHAFISDILVSTGRLLDPPRTRGNENLSLGRLQEEVARIGDSALADELGKLLTAARRSEASARQHRNRRLAHNDLPTILATGRNPLPPVTVADINAILGHLQDFLDTIDRHYRGNTTFFADPIQHGDGDSLARWLRDAVTYREEAISKRRQEAGLPPVPSSLPPEA